MAEAQHDGQRPHRPFSVTLVLLGVFLIGLANGWRALGLMRQSGLLLELGAEPDPRLSAVAALAWALLFFGLAYALWRRKPFTRLVVPVAFLIFGLYHYVLPGPNATAARFQETFGVGAILYAAAVLFAALALNVASGRAYFSRAEKRPAGE